MNIYVGNLNHKASEQELQDLFSQFGEVESTKIIKDNYTGLSKGFAFIEMGNQSNAESAIKNLNETEFLGRKIYVNEARPKTANTGGGGGYKSGNNSYNRNKNYSNNY